MDTSEPDNNPGLSSPSNGAPDSPPAAPKGIGGWVASNFAPLAFVALVIGLIIYRGLVVWDVLLAAAGLGLVIFIHELGHFLAAKWCDVHVETFSIGFGKPLPGCSFKYGETTYKIGWIPLGGFVKMVGEGDNADSDEAEEDPRSFKNKSVGQRMLIISAGVIMNLILGMTCFLVAYMHGVDETPAIVGTVGVGSPAWQNDLRVNDQIVQIDDIHKPTFDDIKPTVMSVSKGDAIPFRIKDASSTERDAQLVPRKNPGELYPTVGISPIDQLTLFRSPGKKNPPYIMGTAASKATAVEGGTHLMGGDKIIATSYDPTKPAEIRDLPLDERDPSGSKPSYLEFQHRQYLLRGKEMWVRVTRGDQTLTFMVPPQFQNVIPGVRLQMGRVAALRMNGPGATAKPIDGTTDTGLLAAKPEEQGTGDRIISVEVTRPDGSKLRFVDEKSSDVPAGIEERSFDPLRLPHELELWAESAKADQRTVRLVVLRDAVGAAKKGVRVTLDAEWDPKLVFNGEMSIGISAPIAISGLGIAYYVENTIDAVAPESAAAKAGLNKGDVIVGVQPKYLNEKGEAKEEKWLEIAQSQGVGLHAALQGSSAEEIKFKVKKAGTDEVELAVTIETDKTFPAVQRGWLFTYDSRLQKAENVGEALGMGLRRTWRTIRVIYQTLYATVFRQISAKTMSGPLSIANASYKIVGMDMWQFIIFIAMININLAIVNFLPVPVLDGGHMVFLIYEKLRGKPPPDKVVEWSLYAGLGMILLLMIFVISLDVRRLFL